MIEYRRTVGGKEVAIHLYHDLTETEEERFNKEIDKKYFNLMKEQKIIEGEENE